MTPAPDSSRSPLRTRHLGLRAALFVAALATVAVSALTHAATPPGTWAQRIDAYIAQPQFAQADWGIAVRSLDTGELLYARHADRLFVPASNAKLFTAGLALASLGRDTRIATTLYATSTDVRLGTLHGDLILYGRGDPSLGLADATPDWAARMAAALAQLGVRRIRGNLIADATYFSGLPVGAGWEANDLQSWFGAPPSALNVQGNQMQVAVTRDGRDCCGVAVTPDAAGVRVVNQTHAATGQPLSLYRPLGSSTLYATGQLPARTQRHDYMLSMPDPPRAAAKLLRQALARAGITLVGEIDVLRWPQTDPELTRSGTRAIASIASPTVADLVAHTLKTSDNLFAQALWLQAGVAAAQHRNCQKSPPPDTPAAWATCALDNLLAQAGIAPGAVLLDEGSGLSRRNLVTPNALAQWLAWATTQPWGVDLRSALPVAGVDGTLSDRFRDGAAANNLQAKTGTLSHAYTLAGFVTDAGGEHLAFALMLNRYARWEIARLQPDVPAPKHLLDGLARLVAARGAKP